VDSDDGGKLSREEIRQGWVLACTARVSDVDCMVDVPAQAGWHGGKFGDPADILQAVPSKYRPGSGQILPDVEAVRLMVPMAERDDGTADLDRFRAALSTVDLDEAEVPLGVLRRVADTIRSAEGAVTVVAERGAHSTRVLAVIAGHEDIPLYGLAVDIGTTSVAVMLVSMSDGTVRALETDYNAQIACGLDVISRINFARREGGLEVLRERVLETINRLRHRVCIDTGILPRDIVAVAVSGNTTMTHLLLGLNPEYIRLEPYSPTFLVDTPSYRAGPIGLEVNPDCNVHLSPAVGSYVGGDITAGVLCTDLVFDSEGICLFMDIGTNGELVIGNADFLMTCACSAGPAFEGGGIGAGMRAAEGAIEKCGVDPETGVASWTMIGEGQPLGICGSGMISLLAELFVTGWLDPAGKLDRERTTPAIRVEGRRARYVLVKAEHSETGREIAISEADIENVLRAKAAIYSATSLMLKQIGIGVEDVAKVYIAGGFGRFIDVEKARVLGLVPDLPAERFVFLGNASLVGTYSVLLSPSHREKQNEIARRMTYVELNTAPSYMEEYTGALFIPHTDPSLFPTVPRWQKR
jgi:uncharacterized 2Fe-2S/4Fe-4S cluster protein (DUF4445 family)